MVNGRRFLAAAFVLVLACRGSKPAVDPRQLAECALAVEAAASARQGEQVAGLARGCSHACPGLAELANPEADADPEAVTRFIAGCSLFCGPDSVTAWRDTEQALRFPALARACGLNTFGLAAGEEHLMSETWLALREIQSWLDQYRGSADETTRTALDRASQRALFSLPLPAHVAGLYELPRARSTQSNRAAIYVIIDGARVRAALVPVARLGETVLDRDTEQFPGPILESPVRDLGALVSRIRKRTSGPPPGPAVPVPIVLADRNTSVARLAEVTRQIRAALGTSRTPILLGVAGYGARAHPIQIESLTAQSSAAHLLRSGDEAWTVSGGGEEIRIARGSAGLASLAKTLRTLSVRWAPQSTVEIEIARESTVTGLVTLLDVIAETKYFIALLNPVAHSQPQEP